MFFTLAFKFLPNECGELLIEVSINLQEIRQLCSYLLELKRASAEEMRRSVYANYTAFIR